jgi:hypothetical protein
MASTKPTAQTAERLPVRRFSFGAFHRLTQGLLSSERAAVFSELPQSLQREAWTDSAERIDAYTALLFAETPEDG